MTVSVRYVPEDFSETGAIPFLPAAHRARGSAGDWGPDCGEDSGCSPCLARTVSTIEMSSY